MGDRQRARDKKCLPRKAGSTWMCGFHRAFLMMLVSLIRLAREWA